MLIGSSHPNGQGCTPLVNQNVNFAALFGAVCRVVASITTSQRGWARTAIHSLPLPMDVSTATIKSQHCSKDILPEALSLPSLKTFMQDATRDAEPVLVDGFPLTTCPQDVPNPIQGRSVGFPGATWSRLLCWLGKVLLDNAPQRAWYAEVVHSFRLCGMLFHDASRLLMVWRDHIYSRIRLFVQLLSIFG